MSDEIQIVEEYRGVGIHDCQDRARIDSIVKPEIDHVFDVSDPMALLHYAEDEYRPPEARLFAAAKLRAMYEMSAIERTSRPNIDLLYVRAVVAGLSSRDWRAREYYGTILERGRAPGEAELPLRPREYGEQVEEDQERQHREEPASQVERGNDNG
jgi:hypothetical protein